MKNIIISDNKTLKGIQKLLATILFLVPIAYLFAYVFHGVSSVFGEHADIFAAIDLTLSLFNISASTMYRPIFGCAFGITYFVFFVKIIKNIIGSITPLKLSFKNDNENSYKSLVVLIDNFGNTLFLLILYMVLCRMISIYSLSTLSIWIIVLGIIILISGKIGIYLIEKKNLTAALYYNLLTSGISCIALAIFLLSVCSVNLYDIFNGLTYLDWLFEDFSNTQIVSILLHFFIKNISFIILQFFALNMIGNVLCYHNYFIYDIDDAKNNAKSFMVATISVSAILLGLSLYVSDSYTLGAVFFTLKKYISVLACSITTLLILKIPSLPKENDPISVSENGAKSDANTIKSDSTENKSENQTIEDDSTESKAENRLSENAPLENESEDEEAEEKKENNTSESLPEA